MWQGRPPAGIRFRMRHLAFLGAWLLVALLCFSGYSGIAHKGKQGDAPPPVVVIAVGAIGLVDLVWLDPWIRSRIRYVLTGTQVLVEATIFGGTIRRFDLARMHDVEMLRNADGSGKLILSAPRLAKEPPSNTILDAFLFASGGKHFTDTAIGIEVDGGIKTLCERFNTAIHEARDRESKA